MTNACSRRDVLSLLGVSLLAPPATTLAFRIESSTASRCPWHSLPAMLSQSIATVVQFDSLMQSVDCDPSQWVIGPGSKLWFAKGWHEARGQDFVAVCRRKRIAALCELDCQRRWENRGPGDCFVELIVYDNVPHAEHDWAETKERLVAAGGRRDAVGGDDVMLVPCGKVVAYPKAFARVRNATMCVWEPFSSHPKPLALLARVAKVIEVFLAAA